MLQIYSYLIAKKTPFANLPTFTFLVILLAMLALPTSVQAKRVEQDKAEKLAKNFVEKKHGKKAKENVRLKHTAKKKMKRQGQKATGKPMYAPAPPPEEQDEPLYYAFNVNEESGGGFVIVAGDDVARPVLGYSDNGSFDEKDMPPNFAYWMDFLQGQIAEAIGDGIEQDEATKMEWEEYIGGMAAPEPVVEPLVQTRWGQGSPYNNMVPMDGEFRSKTGCVATAMAQIMKFHNHPARGIGQSEPYTTGTLKIEVPSVSFDVDYDWGNMLNTYRSADNATEEQENAVATLMYHAGASLKMNYTAGSSGAVTKNIAKSLTTFFGYAKDIQYRQRTYYTNSAWEEMLREQLDAGLPMVYRGQGHAFIADGYDNAGKFHFNWGWGSSGYFVTNALIYSKYNIGQFVIANIKPDGDFFSTYEMALLNFSVNKISVSQNELFVAKVQARNLSYLDAFNGGRWGLALVDGNDNIVAIVADVNAGARAPQTNSSHFEINSFVPETVQPGKYRLRVTVKPTDGDWKLITKSAINKGIPSYFDFTVTPYQGATPGGGYGLALTDFRSERTYAIHGESTQFSMSSALRNIGLEQFPGGQVGAALVDNNDKIVEIIGSANFSALNATANRTATTNATIPATVEPGVYRLRTIARQPANGDWRLVTMSLPGISNRIDFGVFTEGSAGTVAFASADGNGTVTALIDGNAIASGASVELGKKMAFKAVPNSTHIVAGWTVNGEEVLGNATETLEITHFRNETIVTVIFKEKNLYQKVADYALATENTVIAVEQNYTLDVLVNIPAPAEEGVTLTIKSANSSAPVTLRRGIGGNLFKVSSGATLVLENIIIHGGDDGYSDSEEAVNEDELESAKGTLIIVNDGGKFEMNDGTILRNNANLSIDGGAVIVNSGGLFTMNGGNIAYNTTNYNGGGVHINGGTFSMDGGSINGNEGKDGGGIYINNSGVFTLAGGNINDNTAYKDGGGVRMANGTFTMSGGKISNNTAGRDGGGIRMSGGTFTMQDGKINDNFSVDGGGMDVSGSSTTVTMNGGEISGNVSTKISEVTSGRGGGLTVWSSAKFTMNGGKISGNTADLDAGGLYISGANTVFTMNGGEISDNIATGADGGGIRISGGTFTMQDGKISGNTALDGGGMDISGSSTTFTMNGGEISGNVATKIEGNTDAGRGGGMTVWSSAKFTMNGGKITGNAAGVNAGGAYVSGNNTVFTMNGGEIIGNTAPVGNGIHRASGTVNLNGGVVAGTGAALTAVVSGTHNLNKSEDSPNNAAIIAWNKPSGNAPLTYTPGTSTNLTASAGATAVWQNKDGKLGIQYENGENTGFLEITTAGEFVAPIYANPVNPKILKIGVQTIGKTIMLNNVPQDARVQVYNLQGKLISSKSFNQVNHGSDIRIEVQTRGLYIVKAGYQTLRVAVK